jgi:hypothetical protein
LNTLVEKPTLTETIDHTTFLKVLDVSTKAVQRPIMKRNPHHGLREKTFADNMKLESQAMLLALCEVCSYFSIRAEAGL